MDIITGFALVALVILLFEGVARWLSASGPRDDLAFAAPNADGEVQPHAFIADRTGQVCSVCSLGQGHSVHLAFEDVQEETDGEQRWRLIRHERP